MITQVHILPDTGAPVAPIPSSALNDDPRSHSIPTFALEMFAKLHDRVSALEARFHPSMPTEGELASAQAEMHPAPAEPEHSPLDP